MTGGGPNRSRPGSFGQAWREVPFRLIQLQGARGFQRREDGALLVFFAMCCAAIFLIAALSFDLGKRSSTQTELQSFADHVALAAAGELDGMPGAMARAQTAAAQLINEEVTFAEGDGILAGADDFTLTIHDRLPTNEAVYVSPLNTSLPENDQIARFVRIEVTPVQVQWSFARLLSIFSSAALPSENVVAEAAAGHTALACDTTPIFFCMPDPEAGVDTDGIWDPANHIGDALRLQTASGSASSWTPGSMGFVNVSSRVDRASYCFGLGGPELFNCLMTVAATRTQCIENGTLELQDGQVEDISVEYFNARMDRYTPGVRGELRSNPDFPVPPIVTKGFVAGSTCVGLGGTATDDATDFPPDDCFGSGGCTAASGDPDVGDGDWTAGRLEYVDVNYSTDLATLGTVEPAERVVVFGVEYHIDDPFRDEDATNPRRPEYANFPIVTSGASRWTYYNAEVAASYATDPLTAFSGGEAVVSALAHPAERELLDVVDSDGNPVVRQGASLPQCHSGPNISLDPRRRAFVAAAVDCSTEPINGAATARASWFVELFLLDVAEGDEDTGDLTFHVEVISEGLQNTGESHANGTFRNLVQLFR